MRHNRDKQRPRLFYDVQVDLHGMFADEALETVVHTVFANPSCSILVIHGHGAGILRKTVRGALAAGKIPGARSYCFGEDINAPGLDGVTVVYT